MTERALKLKVGLLVLAAAGLLAALLAALGSFSIGRGFAFSVDFDFTGNLHAGAPVKVAGIKVGKVREVSYLGGQKDPRSGRRVYVRLTVWVEERVKGTIFRDAEFYINTQGVLGEQYLEIVPGSDRAHPVAPGDVLVGVTPPRADLIVARLYEFLDGVTRLLRSDKQTISNLLRAGARAVDAMERLLTTNQKELGRILGNLDRLTGESVGLIGGLRQGIGDPARLRRMMGDASRVLAALGKRMDGLLGSAQRALDGATRLAGAVGKPEQQHIRTAIARLAVLAERASGLAGDARGLVAQLRRGKGTAGALLVREELYDDLKEMVRDLKRNPWKFLWRE